MPLSTDNYKDLCIARETWLSKVNGHLRQAVQGAIARHEHFTRHGAYITELDVEEVSRALAVLEDLFQENKQGYTQGCTPAKTSERK
jgi:hypothetical protein